MKNQKIFVNLPVKNLPASVAFFTSLGYAFNAEFTNDAGACMIVSDDISVMLLTETFFQTFTPRPVADATRQTEVILCLACASREEVDAQVCQAVAAGGRTHNEPKDHGFMYLHGFQDLDGHLWELAHLVATKP